MSIFILGHSPISSCRLKAFLYFFTSAAQFSAQHIYFQVCPLLWGIHFLLGHAKWLPLPDCIQYGSPLAESNLMKYAIIVISCFFPSASRQLFDKSIVLSSISSSVIFWQGSFSSSQGVRVRVNLFSERFCTFINICYQSIVSITDMM